MLLTKGSYTYIFKLSELAFFGDYVLGEHAYDRNTCYKEADVSC
jgi:hypothetical protein